MATVVGGRAERREGGDASGGQEGELALLDIPKGDERGREVPFSDLVRAASGVGREIGQKGLDQAGWLG